MAPLAVVAARDTSVIQNMFTLVTRDTSPATMLAARYAAILWSPSPLA